MARIRYIKPEFFDDPVLAGCSQGARLLFIALWQVADRSGVFDPDVRKLKKYAFGYDAYTVADIENMLTELTGIGALCFGTVDNRAYGLVRNLKKHQKFHRDEQAHFEEVASTLEAGCKQGASTLVAARVTGNGERVTETGNGELKRATEIIAPGAKRTQKPKPPSAPAAAPRGFREVVDAWFVAYEKRYGQQPKWGGKQGKQLTMLLGQGYNPEELVVLIGHFFGWQRPEVIRAGHSWGTGYACFVVKLDELRADMADPQRRAEAAQAADRERSDNKKAATISQAERLAQRFTGASNDNSNNQTGNNIGAQRVLGFSEASRPHVRDIQSPTE